MQEANYVASVLVQLLVPSPQHLAALGPSRGWGRVVVGGGGLALFWCRQLLLSLSDITWQTCTGKENLGCPLQSPNDKEAFQTHRCYVRTASVPKELAPLRTTRKSQALTWGEAGGWKIQGHLQLCSGFKNLPQNKILKNYSETILLDNDNF